MQQATLELLLIIISGLCAGSFITMASYRLAVQNENTAKLIFSRSSCPSCNNILKIRSLIPIFSWIFQRGKCTFCHKKISIRYPLIEFSMTAIFVIIYKTSGEIMNIQLLFMLLMAVFLMIMVITDLENYFIPDITQIGFSILVLVFHGVNNDFRYAYYFISAGLFILFGMILDYGFLLFTKKKAIGIDDIKFFGIAGLLLGVDQFPVFMIGNGAAGLIFGLIWQKVTKDPVFPFAPALVISLMTCLLLQGKVNYQDLVLSLIF
jgi:leader peptidase (prepilin peptidase) / N-methyltransferase